LRARLCPVMRERMCGRFSQRHSWSDVHAFLSLLGPAQNLAARYNVAPTQEVGVVRAASGGRRLSMLRWGLLPPWAKDASIAARLINARAETVSEKPSFRSAFRSRRCLVPADGFYEWKKDGKTKLPYRISRADGELFCFAGLWESWQVPDGVSLPASYQGLGPGDEIESFTIITTEAAPSIAHIHGRMPVILNPADFDPWLEAKHDSRGLLVAYDGALEARRVSTRVNKPANDDAALLDPVSDEDEQSDDNPTLF